MRSARIGGPLANGRLDGHVVACPWHGWTFDVRTGRPDHPGGHCVAAYQVKVRRSDIYVGWIKIPPNAARPSKTGSPRWEER
jgi:phenylpropionate dioxygenase-like ring-hydroxylating dioxygenase large terminal subunit